MTRHLLLFFVVLSAIVVNAQTPNTISFQGNLTNPGTGSPIADGAYSMDFGLYDVDVSGTPLWSETQPTVSVSGGLINVQLGSVTPLEIDDFYQPLFLEITIGGETLTPRIALQTVPFAQTAKSVVGSDSIVFRMLDQKAGIVDQTNTALGYYSFTKEQGAGFFNEAYGVGALENNNGGSQNVAIGSFSLGSNTIGTTNIAIGYSALNANTISSNNVAVGPFALQNNTDGTENIGIGRDALINNTTGRDNTAIGSNSMAGVTTGIGNTALGSGALGGNGTYNVAVGYDVLINNNASNNTGVGTYALLANTTGSSNTSLGFAAAESNTLGSGNVAIGRSALNQNNASSENTAVGIYALEQSTGIGNTAIGGNALRPIQVEITT